MSRGAETCAISQCLEHCCSPLKVGLEKITYVQSNCWHNRRRASGSVGEKRAESRMSKKLESLPVGIQSHSLQQGSLQIQTGVYAARPKYSFASAHCECLSLLPSTCNVEVPSSTAPHAADAARDWWLPRPFKLAPLCLRLPLLSIAHLVLRCTAASVLALLRRVCIALCRVPRLMMAAVVGRPCAQMPHRLVSSSSAAKCWLSRGVRGSPNMIACLQAFDARTRVTPGGAMLAEPVSPS